MTANNTAVQVIAAAPAPRGEGPWEVLSEDERTLLDTVTPEDFQILNTVMARLWRPAPLADTLLALESIDGPYKGVVFNVSNFEIQPDADKRGMVPVRFSTRIFQSPIGFTQDEGFDNYAREVFLAWLQYIQTHDLRVIQALDPVGRVQ